MPLSLSFSSLSSLLSFFSLLKGTKKNISIFFHCTSPSTVNSLHNRTYSARAVVHDITALFLSSVFPFSFWNYCNNSAPPSQRSTIIQNYLLNYYWIVSCKDRCDGGTELLFSFVLLVSSSVAYLAETFSSFQRPCMLPCVTCFVSR